MSLPNKETVEKFYRGDSVSDEELKQLHSLFKNTHEQMVVIGYNRLTTSHILQYQLKCEEFIRARKEK